MDKNLFPHLSSELRSLISARLQEVLPEPYWAIRDVYKDYGRTIAALHIHNGNVPLSALWEVYSILRPFGLSAQIESLRMDGEDMAIVIN